MLSLDFHFLIVRGLLSKDWVKSPPFYTPPPPEWNSGASFSFTDHTKLDVKIISMGQDM